MDTRRPLYVSCVRWHLLTWEQAGLAIDSALPPVFIDFLNRGDPVAFFERDFVIFSRVVTAISEGF